MISLAAGLPLNSTLPARFENGAFEFENSNAFHNYTVTNFTNYTETEIPYYIKATSMTFCIVIMCLGVIGNVMVPIVILKTKDMRNSTNIFLVNLSIADLMVLLVCTPTVLVEVNSRPETWLLGKELCLAVPFVELTVAHASVLTILAISFERYYAICEPLRAGYVCTKTRATLICFLAWFFAAVFTSPVLAIAEHRVEDTPRGFVGQCITDASSFWKAAFYLMVTSVLFLLPLVILIVLYTIIAKNLISAASKVVMNKHDDPFNVRARKQVILMLGTVVLSFFVCLAPYRVLVVWIILSPSESTNQMNLESYLNILYFCRVMIYLNSAINPILYNLMSSKFRSGFCKICRFKRKTKITKHVGHRQRAGTFNTGSTSSSTLSRTTNSLKQIFGKRSSVDREAVKTDTELETVDLEHRKHSNKNLNSESIPLNNINDRASDIGKKYKSGVIKNADPSNTRWIYKLFILKDKHKNADSVNRNDVSDLKTFDLSHNTNKIDTERRRNMVECRHRSLEIQGSLRRSVLLNSAKANSVDCEANVEAISLDKLKNTVNVFKDKTEKFTPESYV